MVALVSFMSCPFSPNQDPIKDYASHLFIKPFYSPLIQKDSPCLLSFMPLAFLKSPAPSLCRLSSNFDLPDCFLKNTALCQIFKNMSSFEYHRAPRWSGTERLLSKVAASDSSVYRASQPVTQKSTETDRLFTGVADHSKLSEQICSFQFLKVLCQKKC